MGFVYMLLASASVATERSYIMLAVMFIAILADRPALSMRNLAIAALIILVISPEAALTASLQMSFLAVMGLLAVHEAWGKWLARSDAVELGPLQRAAGVIFRLFCAAALTSLAAGGLSSIAAAYHFGRLAPYSLVANLLALPVMSLLVMPFALFSVIAMPFGLEALPLRLMDAGLILVQAISDWVASLPGAQGQIPTLPLASALLLTLAAIVFCLTRGLHASRSAATDRDGASGRKHRRAPRHLYRSRGQDGCHPQRQWRTRAGRAASRPFCGQPMAQGGRRWSGTCSSSAPARLDMRRTGLPRFSQGPARRLFVARASLP